MKKYSIIEIISIISIISLFFSGFLKTIVSPVFGYIDECILIIYILIYVCNLLIKKTKTISKNSIILILNSILMVILGLIGNYASDYQNVKFAIIVDMFSWLKFFFMFAITYEVVKQERVNKYYEIAKKLSIFFVISGYIVYGRILIGKLNMGSRYGIKVFSLGGHPSFACAFYAVIISIFLHKYNENKKWIIFASILEILTLRSKAFGFCLLVILLILFLRKKINLKKILIAAMGVVVFIWERISYYFLDTTASRAVALITSCKILKKFFPIGSGFATFGTVMSGAYYSKAYYEFGLSSRWGFTIKNNSFIGDGGLATIIGQFGFLGILIFMMNIFIIFNILKKLVKVYKGKITDIIALVGYIGISCTNETFFNSDVSVVFAIVLVILIKKYIKEKGEVNKEENE